MKTWIVIFVRTGCEENTVRMLKEELDADEYLPFIPTKETSHRSRGIIGKKRKILFPGYIFMETSVEPELIADHLSFVLTGSARRWDIYRILHYGNNKKDVAMREKERAYWARLLDSDFCVMGSMGFIEGDAVRITSGALIGMESTIKKINRHRREAVVEMEVMGSLREVRLMLEIVEKR